MSERPERQPAPILPLPERPRTSLRPLPAPLTSLIGRSEEIARLRALVAQPGTRLVTLTGPGGVGKTRLALQLATDLCADFADGVAFVPLAPVREPGLVASAIAQTLGIREQPDRPLVEPLIGALRDRRLLLVLDNFEHVLAAGTLLTELLTACQRLTLLVTSRSWLRLSGEIAFPVPPLTLPERDGGDQRRPADAAAVAEAAAVRLFVERAQAVHQIFALTEANAATVAAICQGLDGLPLAIELAAVHVRFLSPAALLARLERRLPLLAGGPRDAPARLQTMTDAIAWSHDLLSPAEQALFRRLAVFVDGFDLVAAAFVAAVPVDPGIEVLDGIASLVDQSLVEREDGPDAEPRFAMLETIREFGLERLAASGEEPAARTAQAAYLLELTAAQARSYIGPNLGRWLDRIEREQGNFRSALAWTIETGQGTTAVRLADGLRNFWWVRNQIGEGRVWLERALAVGPLEPGPAACRVMSWAGLLAGVQGDAVAAIAHVDAGLAMARGLGDRHLIADSHRHAGQVAGYRGDDAAAVAYHAEAVRVGRELGDAEVLVPALCELGMAHLRLGQLDQATTFCTEGLALSRTTGGRFVTALLLLSLTMIALQERRTEEAVGHLREALDLAVELDDIALLAESLVACAALADALGDPERVGRLLGAADSLREETGRRRFRNHGPYERIRRAAEGALGDQRFAQAWNAGTALPRDQALAEARAGMTDRPVTAASATPERRGAAILTSREREVLRLLAEGFSDKEIGDALGISRRTVSKHVEAILAKLGVASRTAAATYAARHGLV